MRWLLRGPHVGGLVAFLATSDRRQQVHCKKSSPRSILPESWRLSSVHVVFRHGARTPVMTPVPGVKSWHLCEGIHAVPGANGDELPGVEGVRFLPLHVVALDGFSPRPFSYVDQAQGSHRLPGGCRGGQLTDEGAMQAAALGSRLRARYSTLIAGAEGCRLEARTTNVARCVATLSAVLGAMFPLRVEAISAKTTTNKDEYLTPNGRGCERMGLLYAEGRRRWKENPTQEATDVAEELAKLMPADDFASMKLPHYFVRVRDILVCCDAHGMELPWGVDRTLLDRVDKLGAAQVSTALHYKSGDLEVSAARVGLGRYLGELLDNVRAEFDKDANMQPLLSLTSGHDTTILPLLLALKIYDEQWPPFCASIAFEAYIDVHSGERFIRVLYGEEEAILESMEEFEERIAAVIPADYEAECRALTLSGNLRDNRVGNTQTAVGGSSF